MTENGTAQDKDRRVDLSFLREGFVVGRKHDGELWFTFLGPKERPDLILMLGLAHTAVDFISHCRNLDVPSLRQDLLYLLSLMEANTGVNETKDGDM